jgi:outer membrane protein OmpA-like peptidoglycan-associated protein
MKKQFLYLALIMFTITLSAQNSKTIRRADSWFEKNEFRQAAIDYESAIRSAEKSRRTPTETKSYLYTRLGETYFLLREYVRAEINFVRARENGANDLNFLLNYGRALQANDKAREALDVFREALAKNPESEDIRNAILSAEFNIASWSDPRTRLNPVTLETGLNVANNQYALAWYGGALLFSCDRVSSRGGGERIAPTTFFLSQPVYHFNNNRINGWSTPEQINRIEPDPDYFVHSFAYDNNTSTYYIQRCLIRSNALDHRCNIYAYRAEANGKTSKPARQSFHHTGANIGHPTLSSDGNVMIFTSTQAGTSNLYIVKKTGRDTWTEPLLLSSAINTNGEETYPQLFRDSLLFFSSTGHLGMGGLDIFYTEITVNGIGHVLSGASDLGRLEFSKPINLGAPINSGADDVAFLLRPDANGGFFISNRTVGGKNRNKIFSFEREPYVFDEPGKHLAVRQTTSVEPLAGRTVRFVMPERLDTEKAKINLQVAKLNENVFDLNNEVAKNNAEILALQNKKSEPNADPQKLSAQQDALASKNAKLNDEIAKLNDEIAKRNAELAKISAGEPKPIGERSRLDDAITKQNAEITKQNADITKQNANLALLNRNPDQAKVADQRNKLKEQGANAIGNLNAHNDEIRRLNDEIARLSGERIIRVVDTVFVERIVEVPVEVFVERAVPGEILVLRRIFFANNSTELKPASIKELNQVVDAMRKNPNARIEISGHTDVIGTLSHNQQLSEGRAKAVRDYLVEKGISADRLRYAGYNYSKPIAPNTTPEGRARNRRVEIKIL